MDDSDNNSDFDNLADRVRKNQGHPHFPLDQNFDVPEYDRVAYEYGKDKGWYHYDIMWSRKLGYFNTEEEARINLELHLAAYGYGAEDEI